MIISSKHLYLCCSCHCGQCPSLQSMSSSLLSSLGNNLSKETSNSSHLSKCTMANGISQPWLPSSCTGGNNSFCSSHFPTGLFSCDEMNDISPSQLLPTALMMNNLNTCQCPACLNCNDVLCMDQVRDLHLVVVLRENCMVLSISIVIWKNKINKLVKFFL